MKTVVFILYLFGDGSAGYTNSSIIGVYYTEELCKEQLSLVKEQAGKYRKNQFMCIKTETTLKKYRFNF